MARIVPYHPDGLQALCHDVSRVVRTGGIVALPTETFYGLAVSPFDEHAVARLCRVKERSSDKPILVLIGDRSQLAGLVRAIPPSAQLLMDRFWPGPLTIIFPALGSLPNDLTAGTGTVGVRLSSCRPLVEILRQVGPLTGTSANRADAPPASRAQEVWNQFGETIELIVDAGPTPGGLPSTVVETFNSIHLVREGGVPWATLSRVLLQHGFEVTDDGN